MHEVEKVERGLETPSGRKEELDAQGGHAAVSRLAHLTPPFHQASLSSNREIIFLGGMNWVLKMQKKSW